MTSTPRPWPFMATEPPKPKPTIGVLVGEQEILGERCMDGGVCHHGCTDSCFRRECCVPLGASGLTDDWKPPATTD